MCAKRRLSINNLNSLPIQIRGLIKKNSNIFIFLCSRRPTHYNFTNFLFSLNFCIAYVYCTIARTYLVLAYPVIDIIHDSNFALSRYSNFLLNKYLIFIYRQKIERQ